MKIKALILSAAVLLFNGTLYAASGDLTVSNTINAGTGGIKFQDGSSQTSAGGPLNTSSVTLNYTTLPATYTYTGSNTPLFLIAEIEGYGGSNCGAAVDAQWRNASGTVIRAYTRISGTNITSQGDGGSGMTDSELATIPFFTGTKYIDFRRNASACRDVAVHVIGLTEQQ